MKELISVIVPVYQVEQYIGQCIESITNQTYQNLQIILIDDGSKDQSGKICDEYAKRDKRIQVIHKENGGLSDARNTGLKLSKGAYIQFIDGDDYIEPDMISFLYEGIKQYQADISMCSYYILKNQKVTTDASEKIKEYTSQEILKELLLDTKIHSYAWNKLISKRCIEGIEFPKGRTLEDIITMPKVCARAEKIVLMDMPKYYYRQREGSILNKITDELYISYIQASMDTIEFIRCIQPQLEIYCEYNMIHITINTYNAISKFNMTTLKEEQKVKDLYQKVVQLMQKKEVENFVVEHASSVKKLHLYYLLSDVDGYIKNNKNIPPLYS